jgi:ribosomal protein L2
MDPKKKRIRRIKKLAESMQPLQQPLQHPRGHTGRGHKTGHTSPSYKGGHSKEYLVARIARDHPDILERMKAGEYEYVRQAAIAAGIIRQKEKTS